MYNRQLLLVILVILPLISLVLAAKVTTPKPTASIKSNATAKATATTKARSGTRRVITTRLGADGAPEEQCACTVFYLCDKDNVVQLTNGNACDQDGVCCAVPMGSLIPTDDVYGQSGSPTSSQATPFVGSETTSFIQETSPSFLPTSTPPPDCVCVPFYQCTDYDPLVASSGAGIINPRIPCDAPDVCCPRNQVTSGSTGSSQTPITPSSTDPIIPTATPTPNPEECGIRRAQVIDTRIVSPETLMRTSFGEFPWMALILTTEIAPNGTRTENVFVCGASLLSPFIVLTAAHCVNDANIGLLKIRVGEYDTHRGATEPLPHQDRPVSAMRVHPNFNAKVLFNDIALLTVNEAFQLAPHVSPICAPMMNNPYAASDVYNPNQCIATGWGKNAFAEGNFQSTLRKVDLAIIPRDQCQSQLRETRLGQFFNLDPSFVCAGGQPGFDTCQGDGGGPLFCATHDNPNRYVQVGIVSWGIGCANSNPGVYASLDANREWLTTEFNSLTIFRRG